MKKTKFRCNWCHKWKEEIDSSYGLCLRCMDLPKVVELWKQFIAEGRTLLECSTKKTVKEAMKGMSSSKAHAMLMCLRNSPVCKKITSNSSRKCNACLDYDGELKGFYNPFHKKQKVS